MLVTDLVHFDHCYSLDVLQSVVPFQQVSMQDLNNESLGFTKQIVWNKRTNSIAMFFQKLVVNVDADKSFQER